MKDIKSMIEALKVQPLSEEEKQQKHILKRLAGPIASCVEATRNDRHYNKPLWTKALNDDLFKEKIKTKSLFLELGHPEDREETDMTKVCACIPEMPQIIGDDLYATVDVLDTPNGRLLNTLIDYGFVPGISSRGSGDVNGNEVDPDTFFLETWDIVQIPALEKARLTVTESLKNKKTLKQALTESLANVNEEDKRIMKETLKELNINLDNNEETREDKEVLKKETKEEKKEDNDVVSNQVVKGLREALKSKELLETQLQKLQEEKAISDTKVLKLEEELKRYKDVSVRLSKQVNESKGLKKENLSLKEQLEEKEKLVSSKEETIKSQDTIISQKNARIKKMVETLNSKNEKIVLKENIDKTKESYEKQVKVLNEKLENLKVDSQSQIKDYSTKLAKSNKLVEKYKGHLNTCIEKYINVKAQLSGVKPQEIKNRLNESYTFDDIDTICKELESQKARFSKLPFNVSKDTRIRITESKQSRYVNNDDPDDDISNLTELAGL